MGPGWFPEWACRWGRCAFLGCEFLLAEAGGFAQHGWVRVPLPVVILLAIAVVAGTWWGATRQMDFLTPPTAERLAITRQLATTWLPRAEVQLPSVAPEPPEVDRSPPRRIETRPPRPASETAERNPKLDTYVERAAKGSRHLIELANLMDASGDRQRALLAWERVLDSCKPGSTHYAAALTATRRLRGLVPAWRERNAPFEVVVHVNTTAAGEASVKPVLEKVRVELEQASAGILKVGAELTATRKVGKGVRSLPVSLWLSGAGDEPRKTETLSFLVKRSTNLQGELQRQLFKVVVGQLGARGKALGAAAAVEDETPLDALSFRITRLRWFEFGRALNPAPAPAPAPVSSPSRLPDGGLGRAGGGTGAKRLE